MSKRTTFGLGLAIFILALVQIAEAQQTKKVPKIAVLRPMASSDFLTEAFRQGLRQLGYIEGRNISIDYRFTAGQEHRLPEIAAELAQPNVDVIVVSSTPAARAVLAATKTVPIVFVAVSDPVVSGLVSSLARPGGNVTGLTTEPTPELSGKRLAILKEVVPGASRIVALNNPANPATAIVSKEINNAAQKLGLNIHFLDVQNATEIESAFEAVPKLRANALLVLVDPLFIIHRKRIVDLTAKSALPAVFPWKEFVDAGGLMSYGPSLAELWQRATIYVDKILRGAKPADLPVERPQKIAFVINLNTAKQIGLTIPPNVVVRADTVIK
jgi:putative tryptophan/tyrosine transport system substrate-binding protein